MPNNTSSLPVSSDGAAALRVEEVSDRGQLSRYRPIWDALVAKSADASIFNTYEWVTSWLDSFWQNEVANDLRKHINVAVFRRLSMRGNCCRLYERSIKPFVRRTMPRLVYLKARRSPTR